MKKDTSLLLNSEIFIPSQSTADVQRISKKIIINFLSCKRMYKNTSSKPLLFHFSFVFNKNLVIQNNDQLLACHTIFRQWKIPNGGMLRKFVCTK